MDLPAIDPASAVAPYEQLRTAIAVRASSGALPAGSRLPTVRALAGSLGLAVNTVARAYRELESDGVVVTEGRRGTFIAASAAASSGVAVTAAGEYAGTARRLGLTLDEATRLLTEHWPR